MTRRIALFPISLDSRLFSARIVKSAIKQIALEYESVIILFADQLQLYNKATGVDSIAKLRNLSASEPSHSAYLSERRIWLNKIRKSLSDSSNREIASFDVRTVDDVADGAFYRIYRRVRILFCVNAKFRSDVIEAAIRHADSNPSQANRNNRVELSTSYIIEEIALNIRIRVVNDIRDEYYLGSYPSALLNIYAGAYGVSVCEMASHDKIDCGLWRFFSFDQESLSWFREDR